MTFRQIKVKIGIDVATKKTGFAFFVEDTPKYYGTIETSPDMVFGGTKVQGDINEVYNNIWGVLVQFKRDFFAEDETPHVIAIICLEMSTHSNHNLSQKLHTYCGIYASTIVNAINILFPHNETTLKFVTPREWQLRIFDAVLDRTNGKVSSKDYASKLVGYKVEDDDTADALCIGSIADKLRDMLNVKNELNTRTKTLVSTKVKIINLENRIVALKKRLLNKKIEKLKKRNFDKDIKDKPILEFANKKEFEKYEMLKKEMESLGYVSKNIKSFTIKGDK